MKNTLHTLRLLGALSLAGMAGLAQASLVAYTTQASFLAAVSNPAVDGFAGVGAFGAVNYGLTRTIGTSGYGYHAWEPAAPGGFSSKSSTSVAGSTANPAVSSYYFGVPLVIDDFANSGTGASVQAVGGNFYNSNSALQFVAGTINVTALDLDGTTSFLSVSASRNATNTFLGFVSTTGLQSLTIRPSGSSTLATVDNLTLASARQVETVPEPGTGSLVMAGAAVAWFAGRRRQRASRRGGPVRGRP